MLILNPFRYYKQKVRSWNWGSIQKSVSGSFSQGKPFRPKASTLSVVCPSKQSH